MDKIINIPLGLSTWVLREGMIRPFQLYIFLNLNYTGQFKYDLGGIRRITSQLGYSSRKTVDQNLVKLFQHNYVGFDPKRQIVYVRPLQFVLANIGITDRHIVTFSMWNIRKWKELIIASSLRYLSYKCKLLKKKTCRSYHRGEELYQAIFI
jgi:hypothetical protein